MATKRIDLLPGWNLSPVCKYCGRVMDMSKKEEIAFNNREEVFHINCYEIREGVVL